MKYVGENKGIICNERKTYRLFTERKSLRNVNVVNIQLFFISSGTKI